MLDFNENCPLCKQNIHKVLWNTKNCKAIEVINENFGLHRVIWNKHVKEINELTAKEALELMQNVLKLEKYVKAKYNPDKLNIASLWKPNTSYPHSCMPKMEDRPMVAEHHLVTNK